MLRKVLSPVAHIFFKPYFRRLEATQLRFDEAVKTYNEGNKHQALAIFNELVLENAGDKASRGWVGRISGELEIKAEQQKPTINRSKP